MDNLRNCITDNVNRMTDLLPVMWHWRALLKSFGAYPQQKEKMQKAEYSWQTKSEWLLTELLALCATRESVTIVRTMEDKRPLQSTKGQLQAASQCSQMIEKGKYILWSSIEIRLQILIGLRIKWTAFQNPVKDFSQWRHFRTTKIRIWSIKLFYTFHINAQDSIRKDR